MSAGRIAILVDGGFFLKRLPKLVPHDHCDSAGKIVACMRQLCRQHVRMLIGDDETRWRRSVYRIFYYDAIPYGGKSHHPVLNYPIDFAKSDVAKARHELFASLRREPKLALRLGRVSLEHDWTISTVLTKKLLRTRKWLDAFDHLNEDGSIQLSVDEVLELRRLREIWQAVDSRAVSLGLRQKGVDMRIGVDIAALTLKKHVDTIVLVAGDSDFVPAAKLARREGVEFVLDPLWQQVNADLFENIDGLRSGLKSPAVGQSQLAQPP